MAVVHTLYTMLTKLLDQAVNQYEKTWNVFIFDFWPWLTYNLNILLSHALKGLARNNYLEMFALVTQSPTQ